MLPGPLASRLRGPDGSAGQDAGDEIGHEGARRFLAGVSTGVRRGSGTVCAVPRGWSLGAPGWADARRLSLGTRTPPSAVTASAPSRAGTAAGARTAQGARFGIRLVLGSGAGQEELSRNDRRRTAIPALLRRGGKWAVTWS